MANLDGNPSSKPDLAEDGIDRRAFIAGAALFALTFSAKLRSVQAEDQFPPQPNQTNYDTVGAVIYPGFVFSSVDYSEAKVTTDIISSLLQQTSSPEAMNLADHTEMMKRLEQQICNPPSGMIDRDVLLNLCDQFYPNPFKPVVDSMPSAISDNLDLATDVLGFASLFAPGSTGLALGVAGTTLGYRDRIYHSFDYKTFDSGRHDSFILAKTNQEMLALHYRLYNTNPKYREYAEQLTNALKASADFEKRAVGFPFNIVDASQTAKKMVENAPKSIRTSIEKFVAAGEKVTTKKNAADPNKNTTAHPKAKEVCAALVEAVQEVANQKRPIQTPSPKEKTPEERAKDFQFETREVQAAVSIATQIASMFMPPQDARHLGAALSSFEAFHRNLKLASDPGLAKSLGLGTISIASGFLGAITLFASIFNSGPSDTEVILEALQKISKQINDGFRNLTKYVADRFDRIEQNQVAALRLLNAILQELAEGKREISGKLDLLESKLNYISRYLIYRDRKQSVDELISELSLCRALRSEYEKKVKENNSDYSSLVPRLFNNLHQLFVLASVRSKDYALGGFAAETDETVSNSLSKYAPEYGKIAGSFGLLIDYLKVLSNDPKQEQLKKDISHLSTLRLPNPLYVAQAISAWLANFITQEQIDRRQGGKDTTDAYKQNIRALWDVCRDLQVAAGLASRESTIAGFVVSALYQNNSFEKALNGLLGALENPDSSASRFNTGGRSAQYQTLLSPPPVLQWPDNKAITHNFINPANGLFVSSTPDYLRRAVELGVVSLEPQSAERRDISGVDWNLKKGIRTVSGLPQTEIFVTPYKIKLLKNIAGIFKAEQTVTIYLINFESPLKFFVGEVIPPTSPEFRRQFRTINVPAKIGNYSFEALEGSSPGDLGYIFDHAYGQHLARHMQHIIPLEIGSSPRSIRYGWFVPKPFMGRAVEELPPGAAFPQLFNSRNAYFWYAPEKQVFWSVKDEAGKGDFDSLPKFFDWIRDVVSLSESQGSQMLSAKLNDAKLAKDALSPLRRSHHQLRLCAAIRQWRVQQNYPQADSLLEATPSIDRLKSLAESVSRGINAETYPYFSEALALEVARTSTGAQLPLAVARDQISPAGLFAQIPLHDNLRDFVARRLKRLNPELYEKKLALPKFTADGDWFVTSLSDIADTERESFAATVFGRLPGLPEFQAINVRYDQIQWLDQQDQIVHENGQQLLLFGGSKDTWKSIRKLRIHKDIFSSIEPLVKITHRKYLPSEISTKIQDYLPTGLEKAPDGWQARWGISWFDVPSQIPLSEIDQRFSINGRADFPYELMAEVPWDWLGGPFNLRAIIERTIRMRLDADVVQLLPAELGERFRNLKLGVSSSELPHLKDFLNSRNPPATLDLELLSAAFEMFEKNRSSIPFISGPLISDNKYPARMPWAFVNAEVEKRNQERVAKGETPMSLSLTSDELAIGVFERVLISESPLVDDHFSIPEIDAVQKQLETLMVAYKIPPLDK